MATSIDAAGPKPKSRVLLLVTLLNAILLGWLLYSTFGKSLATGEGVSVTLINDTPSALVDLSLRYPGGSFDLVRIDPISGSAIPCGTPANSTRP